MNAIVDDAAARIQRLAEIAKRDPRRRFVWSTGEQIAVAMVLNKPTWLKEQGYSLLEAVERLGEDWFRASLIVQRSMS